MTSAPLFQPVAGIPAFQPITGGIFSLGPELAPWGANDQSMFAFAVGTDQALWYTQLNGYVADTCPPATWSGWQSLGGVVMCAPRAVRSGEPSVDVFAAGANSDLLHWQFLNGSWVEHLPIVQQDVTPALSPPPGEYVRYWESLGGVLTSPPSAVMYGDSYEKMLVFVRGWDHALWSRTFVNGSWNDWVSSGHTLASAPHAIVVGGETLVVFVLGSDSAIWYMMGSEWHSLGGTFTSAPYPVTDGKRIFVFANDTDRAVRWRMWDGSHWNDWQSLGGTFMSPPIANCPIEDLPYVYALGIDSGIWRKRWAGQTWFDWELLGTGLLSLPATTTRFTGPFFRELAGLGPDHQVWFQEDDY
jgi:hypothetical protein